MIKSLQSLRGGGAEFHSLGFRVSNFLLSTSEVEVGKVINSEKILKMFLCCINKNNPWEINKLRELKFWGAISLQSLEFVMGNRPFVERASWFLMCWSRLPVGWYGGQSLKNGRGRLTKEAITEAVRLAREVLLMLKNSWWSRLVYEYLDFYGHHLCHATSLS